MSRRLAPALLAAALLACSAATPAPAQQAAPAASIAELRPTAMPSPTLVPAVAESIQLTGALTAQIDQAAVGQPCGHLAPGYYLQARFPAGGTTYELEIMVADYSGPGTYEAPPAKVSVHTLGLSDHPVLFAGVRGSVVIASGEKSGSLDSDLASQSDQAHVAGSWRCP